MVFGTRCTRRAYRPLNSLAQALYTLLRTAGRVCEPITRDRDIRSHNPLKGRTCQETMVYLGCSYYIPQSATPGLYGHLGPPRHKVR